MTQEPSFIYHSSSTKELFFSVEAEMLLYSIIREISGQSKSAYFLRRHRFIVKTADQKPMF